MLTMTAPAEGNSAATDTLNYDDDDVGRMSSV